MKNRLAYFIAVLLLASACKKKNADNNEVSFNNRIDKDVTLTIYASADDYAKATNAMLRKVIKANTVERIAGNTFTAGKAYYMDWHTDNYYQNNWFNDSYPQQGAQVAFTPGTGKNDYYIEQGLTGNGRIVFLSGSGTSSKWRAVNAYLFSTSTGYVSFWSSLPDAQRLHEVTINKNFSATHDYKNTNGTPAQQTLSFKVMRTNEAYIQFMAGDTTLGSMISGRLPTGKAPDYFSASTDTVMALFPQSDYYFMMVRN
ncbi:hypothetical protein CAP35_15165 [Chitinophagaceae bacterium IBVUCB1]|nr:hypothetical protein CAP35_15165 [Chitinophagaceae bacterium IBVUCB1]